MRKKLAEKYGHMSLFWNLDGEGYPKDGHLYVNSVTPDDPYADSYNDNGLPKSPGLWKAFYNEIALRAMARLSVQKTVHALASSRNVHALASRRNVQWTFLSEWTVFK